MRTVSIFHNIVLCAFLLFFGSHSLAFNLVADSQLDKSTADQVQSWLNKVTDRLPPIMKSRFGDRIFSVKFSMFKGTEMAQVIPGSSQIDINQSLLIFLQKPDLQRLPLSDLPSIARKIEALKKQSHGNQDLTFDLPSHKNIGQFLTATLIHEISHQYDMLGVPPMEYLATRKQCVYAAAIGERDYSQECQKIQNIRTSVSDLREFLILAGFPETGFLASNSNKTNFYTERSPDPYEWQSPLESFAVNMEYFLLDPDYQCRRPGLYRYLSKHFGDYNPFEPRTCDNTQTVLVDGPSEFGSLTRFEKFDFNKLYQIHYFFAGKGDEMMSRFGHAMLRLVFCAPQRTTVGPECLKDQSFHRIVSFRAFVTDINIDSIKGLTGDYPSSLYILPLASVLTEYNSTEFREITSTPLKLSRSRLKVLFDSILYNHWTYEGKYYFLSNNCATETLNLLKSVFYDYPKIFDRSIARPDTLYNLLVEIGVAEDLKKLVKSKEEAVQLGYFFPSFRETYENSIKLLIEKGALPAGVTLDGYLELSGVQRRQWMNQEISRADAADQKLRNLAGFVFLEDLVLSRKLQKVNQEVLPKIYLESRDKEAVEANPSLADVGFFQDYVFKFSRPTTLFSQVLNARPYGHPSSGEISPIVESFNKSMAESKFDKKSVDFTNLVIAKASSDLQGQYHDADQNLKDLIKQIKMLKRTSR